MQYAPSQKAESLLQLHVFVFLVSVLILGQTKEIVCLLLHGIFKEGRSVGDIFYFSSKFL